jgi:hypothetical protein
MAEMNTCWNLTTISLFALLLGNAAGAKAAGADSKQRHERVAERRQNVHVICHRGASEFAHENTLEAYRATFELGGDGNEIDIRITKDGVLVCFHDDMLDHLLEAYGDVSDYTWQELQRFRFREPGRFGNDCRIPTLEEAFELHREFNGLMHLDIKRPNLDKAIAELLGRLDMWDHVAYCNLDHGGVLLKDGRIKLCRYKAGLYLDRSEVFPAAIAEALKKPGEGIIVDDPRGTILELGRALGDVSKKPVPRRVSFKRGFAVYGLPSEEELLETLLNDSDWNQIAQTVDERAASGKKILERAEAADSVLKQKLSSPAVFAALEQRVRQRSLHKDWQYHGLDGAISLRSLILLKAPNAIELARFALWRDDPALEAVANPLYKNPRSWTDFRIKMLILPALAHYPSVDAEKLCRDYLALTDDEANRLGPSQFEEAARCLLSVSPKTETALELLRHRLQVVRGRAILHCLAHGSEEWSRAALKSGAPHALGYLR